MKYLKTTLAGFAAFAILGGAAILTTGSAAPAFAQASSAKAVVEQAKNSGKIGETISGYLDVVPGASLSSAEQNAMNEINIGRKSVYTRLAREQNVSVEVVAALTGEKQIAKQRSGKVMTETGWKKAG